jgi:hypothetical protein
MCGHHPAQPLDKLRGSGLAIGGSAADAGPATRAGLAGIAARSIHEVAVDTPRGTGLDRGYCGQCPALRLLYNYMASGTAV